MKVGKEVAPICDRKLMRTSSRILEKKPIPGLNFRRETSHDYQPLPREGAAQSERTAKATSKMAKILRQRKQLQRLTETTHHSFTAAKECFKETPSSSTCSNLSIIGLGGGPSRGSAGAKLAGLRQISRKSPTKQ